MSTCALDLSEATQRISNQDRMLHAVNLCRAGHVDEDLNELVDQLIAQPNIIELLYLSHNQLTDSIGLKIAQYIAKSKTIKAINISFNNFSAITLLAIAKALRINTSLHILFLNGHILNATTEIDNAFITALHTNPSRQDGHWSLYNHTRCEFSRLKTIALELGHPNMQSLVFNNLLNREMI